MMRMIRIIPWMVIAPLFLVPVAAAVSAAFRVPPGQAGRTLTEWWASPAVRSSLSFSLLQAALSSLLALALGLPGAMLLARYRFRGKSLLLALTGIPFVFPPALFTLGFTGIFGRNGMVNTALMALTGLAEPPLNLVYSLWGVVLAHGLFNFPLMMGLAHAALRGRSGRMEDAARMLGAGEVRIFLTITLPGLVPSLGAAVSLVFLYCFMSFAIPLSLGGGPSLATLEVTIYALVNGSQDFAGGAAVALLEGLVSLGVLCLWVLLRKAGHPEPMAGTGTGTLAGLPFPLRMAARLWLGFTGLLAVAPALSLLRSSFLHQGRPGSGAQWSLASWGQAFSRPGTLQAMVDSGLVALGVGGLACLLALVILAGERRGGGGAFRSVFFALPVALSGVMLSLGYLVLFPLGGSPVILVIIQATTAYPLAYRILGSARARIPDSLEEAASLLGAGRLKVWRTVDLPLLLPALLSAWALGAALSLGEINAALMLNLRGFPLLGLEAYRLMGSYQHSAASALGVLICLLSGLAFWAAGRAGTLREGVEA